MIVGAHLSLRIARRRAELPSGCAQRLRLATLRGETVEAFIAGGERTGACSPSAAVAADTREVTVAAVDVRRVRRCVDARATGGSAPPAGARAGQDGAGGAPGSERDHFI
jgi:hypothetical protein